jgi:hypothetical protein
MRCVAIGYPEIMLGLKDPLFGDLIDVCAKMIDDNGTLKLGSLERTEKKGKGKERNQSCKKDWVEFFHSMLLDDTRSIQLRKFRNQCITAKMTSPTEKC